MVSDSPTLISVLPLVNNVFGVSYLLLFLGFPKVWVTVLDLPLCIFFYLGV